MAAERRLQPDDWLLFTDADTVHKPGSLARAVSEAQQRSATLLSYSPEQEVRGFWEKSVMPVIFAELAATYRPAQVSDPRSSAAAATVNTFWFRAKLTTRLADMRRSATVCWKMSIWRAQ